MSTRPGPAQLAELLRPTTVRTGPLWSLAGVWYRHYRVYTRTLLANAAPPVLEPLFFFTAVAIGLGGYIREDGFGGLGYRAFVASGLAVSSAMFTAVFETTYDTFVRLVFRRTYDAMLGTHLRVNEMFIGELLFAASKGLVFSTVVLLVTALFGVRPSGWGVLVPLVGFVTAYLFGAIGLIVTSCVKMINNYAFFTSGVITPLFFFSGTFFPIYGHHVVVDAIAWVLPLTHPIEISRALYRGAFTAATGGHLLMLAAWIGVAHVVALRRMRARVVG